MRQILAAGAVLLFARAASADEVLAVAGESVDGEAVRAALAADLGVPVTTGADPTVRVRELGAERVQVVVRGGGARTIDVPRDRALAAKTIAFAASTLLRDDAMELVLARAPKEEPEPPPPPPPEPPAAPEPKRCGERGPVFSADFAPYVGTSSFQGIGSRDVAFNVIAGYGHGVGAFELAGVANVERSGVCGAQISGVANVVAGPVTGMQLSTVNVARDVDGLQLGMVNVSTAKVRGVQLGLVNYANDSDAAIGLVSIVKNGRTDAEGWVTESGLSMVGVRHGGKVVHNVFGAGYRVGVDGVFALALGIGARAHLGERLVLDLDFLDHSFSAPRGSPGSATRHLLALQAGFAYDLSRRVALVAAPSLDLLVSQDPNLSVTPVWGSVALAKGDTRVNAWPGLSLGARVNL
jgi:hypothetical protein